MIGCSKKNRENYPGKCFEQKKNKPRLKFNPGLALIGLRTTGPWAQSSSSLVMAILYGFAARCLFGVVFVHNAKQGRLPCAVSSHKSLPHQSQSHPDLPWKCQIL